MRFIITTFFAVLMGVSGAMVLQNHYFNLYPVIPVYFYLLTMLSIYLIDRYRQRMPNRLVIVYMATKGFKFILTMLLLLVLCAVVKDINVIVLLFTFGVFYIVYLIFETWLFFHSEAGLKREKKNETDHETIA